MLYMQARCGDRVKVSQDHTFKKAVFNPVVAVQFNDTLTQTRDVLKEVSITWLSHDMHLQWVFFRNFFQGGQTNIFRNR